MKVILLFFIPLWLSAQINFNEYFDGNTLRLDLYHTGNAKTAYYSLEKSYKLGKWFGPQKNLVDPFSNGKYRFSIYAKQENKLIYQYYFSSLLGEWQTTADAKKRKYTMKESLYLPFPLNEIIILIDERTGEAEWIRVFNKDLDPDDKLINNELFSQEAIVEEMQNEGPVNEKIDLAIVAEGYLAHQKDMFRNDAQRLIDHLFSIAPFDEFKSAFNVWLVFQPSLDEGPDNPMKGKYSRTAVGASFYTFNSQRYMTTEANGELHALLVNIPHDQIYILVNEQEYGGGGIFNFYNVTSVGNSSSDFVFVHEFGHGFGGLGDEYYSSDTGYDEFYLMGVEPPEPNITANTNRATLKWKHLIKASTPVPTPWKKDEFDQEVVAYGRRMKEQEDPELRAEERNRHKKWVAKFFKELPYAGEVGVYEGAGYQTKGLYRPTPNCIMITKDYEAFCPVCQDAIINRIKWFTDKR